MIDFLKDLWKDNKKDIFQVLVMLILFIWALLSMQRCSMMKLNYETSKNILTGEGVGWTGSLGFADANYSI